VPSKPFAAKRRVAAASTAGRTSRGSFRGETIWMARAYQMVRRSDKGTGRFLSTCGRFSGNISP